MKLKKKTRKQLNRLARAASALGASFATEVLVAMSASFAASREGATSAEDARAPRKPPPDGASGREHAREPQAPTADQH